MKNRWHPLIWIGLLALGACKTQDAIRREQMVDNISVQMVQSQQMTADATVRLQALEERLGLLTGQVQEQEYQTIRQTQQELQGLKEQLKVIELRTQSQQTLLDKNTKELADQKKFLNDLMKTLSSITGDSGAKKPNSTASLYEQAMEDYSRGRYAQAKTKLEQVLNGNQVKGNQRARTLHNLGMIAWMDKEDNKAQVYFSRLITEHSGAPQESNGMLFLAKSFQRTKNNSEARQILEELIKRHPQAKQVTEAKKILAGL